MAADEAPAFSGARMWLAGVVLALSNFMVVLDTSIANVSVPHIAGSLAIAPDQGTWVITSYSVADAICVPLTGWLATRFGSVRTFLFAMAGFCLFSLLCGLSVSLGMLVVCRVGQGFCGGPLMPLTQTLLLRVFPPAKRGQAMAIWAMTTVLAPIAGPLLGGAISDNWSWHWIFFINLPIGAACLIGTWTLVRKIETKTERQPIDVTGLVLLFVWVGALQIMLDIGRDHDWFASSRVIALAIVAAIGFCAFLIWELTEKHPVVDVRVFRHRGFTVAVVALSLTYGAYFSSVVVTPQWLQGAMGYTAQWSGQVIAWSGLLALVFSPLAGRLSSRADPRLLVSIGVIWMAFAIGIRSHWNSGVDYWTLAIPHLLIGAGVPFFFVPLSMLTLSSVETSETASAAGLSSFARTLSGALATSIATTMWANNQQTDRAHLVDALHTDQSLADRLGGLGMGDGTMRALLSRLVDQESVALATTHLFQISAALMLFAAAFVWLVPKPTRAVDTSQAH